jgi:hypothetical protein
MMKRILITLFFFVFLCIKLAGQRIDTDRPDQTDSPTIIPIKSFQIESGFLDGYTYNSGNRERQLLLPTTLLRYGLSKNIEIRIVEQVERI